MTLWPRHSTGRAVLPRELRFAGAALILLGLTACAGGGGRTTRPSAAAATSPAGIAAGTALQIVSGETGEGVDGATVTIGGQSYTTVGGRITLTDRALLQAEMTVQAEAMLERRTLVRNLNATRFTLWPERSPTGMNPDFTQNLVYTRPNGPGPLRRLTRGTTRVVVIPAPELRGDAEMAAHEDAVNRINAVTGGQVTYVLGTEKPVSGYVEARLGGADDALCNEPNVLGFAQDFTRNGEIVHSLIVYCDPKSARTAVVSHEIGHTFGLHHSPEKGELMYAFFNGHGAVEFSAREGLEMRLMLQRPGGNVFPDDDRAVSTAGATGTHVTVCPSRP